MNCRRSLLAASTLGALRSVGVTTTLLLGLISSDAVATPVITSSPVTTATVGLLYTYDVEAMDTDISHVLTYSLDPVPPSGMAIDPTTGLIQWTPTMPQAGPNDVTVRVTDNIGLFDTQSFTIVAVPEPATAAIRSIRPPN